MTLYKSLQYDNVGSRVYKIKICKQRFDFEWAHEKAVRGHLVTFQVQLTMSEVTA